MWSLLYLWKMMADIPKMKGPYQFHYWGMYCHLEIFRGYAGGNIVFCSLKLPAGTATNVKIIGRKYSLLFWLWNMQSCSICLPESKALYDFPVVLLSQWSFYTNEYLGPEHPVEPPGGFMVQISLFVRPPAQASIIGLYCPYTMCVFIHL